MTGRENRRNIVALSRVCFLSETLGLQGRFVKLSFSFLLCQRLLLGAYEHKNLAQTNLHT
jgi:hypothetical protein